MNRFFRLNVDEAVLTDALYAFVVEPSATSRNALPVIRELNDVAHEMVEFMESMVLDGVDERHYVADYVHAVGTGEGMTEAMGDGR
jgi:hypothetical protein